MTTRSSPIQQLKAQADRIARVLKVHTDRTFGGKAQIKFAVVMDDKIITIDVTREYVDKTPEKVLAKYVLDLMQE